MLGYAGFPRALRDSLSRRETGGVRGYKLSIGPNPLTHSLSPWGERVPPCRDQCLRPPISSASIRRQTRNGTLLPALPALCYRRPVPVLRETPVQCAHGWRAIVRAHGSLNAACIERRQGEK